MTSPDYCDRIQELEKLSAELKDTVGLKEAKIRSLQDELEEKSDRINTLVDAIKQSETEIDELLRDFEGFSNNMVGTLKKYSQLYYERSRK